MNLPIQIAVTLFLMALAFVFGAVTMQQYYEGKIQDIEKAVIYEDGSWNATFKDGKEDRGCIKGGLCRD